MKKQVYLLIMMIAVLLSAAACSDDDDNGVVPLPWSDANVRGQWSLDTVFIEHMGNDDFQGRAPLDFKNYMEKTSVYFDGANVTISGYGNQVLNRSYSVHNFYIKLGNTDLSTDTLNLQSLDETSMRWMKLRQYTDHTHRHYVVYHLNKQ